MSGGSASFSPLDVARRSALCSSRGRGSGKEARAVFVSLAVLDVVCIYTRRKESTGEKKEEYFVAQFVCFRGGGVRLSETHQVDELLRENKKWNSSTTSLQIIAHRDLLHAANFSNGLFRPMFARIAEHKIKERQHQEEDREHVRDALPMSSPSATRSWLRPFSVLACARLYSSCTTNRTYCCCCVYFVLSERL